MTIAAMENKMRPPMKFRNHERGEQMTTFICKRCGAEQERTTPKQRMCAACREIRKRESAERNRERYRQKRAAQPKACVKCGRALYDYRKKYCSFCTPLSSGPRGQGKQEEKKEPCYRPAVRLQNGEGIRGKSLEEINRMARECGMSYGKFCAWVSARGAMPPRRG